MDLLCQNYISSCYADRFAVYCSNENLMEHVGHRRGVVHLQACLDACILWEKSVANVRCRICRRNKDDDSLLLCDGCNSGFHLYCLRPPLHSIPSGDWFCVSCKPPSCSGTNSHQRRNRREALEASDSEEARSSATDSDEESSSSGEREEERDASLRRRQQRSPRSRLRCRPSARQPMSRSSSRSSQPFKTLAKSRMFPLCRAIIGSFFAPQK